MRVSHETIYRSLFLQARGVLKQELTSTCAPSGVPPLSQSLYRVHRCGQIVDAISIR